MAGQYRFKDINGNVVAQISSSADGTISFSGSAVDFSNASTITLGEVQLAGTASNALLLDGFDSTAFVFTSSFNTISQSISSQLNTLQTTSGSNIGRLNNLESKSSSVDISISNINTVTESVLSRTSNLETKSSSIDISISNINSFTASNGNTSLNNLTGSLATTGSNTFFGTQTYSGSVYIANDLIVQGSSSIQYISASSVSIGTNIVQLNTANPSVRFAGLTIIDSGSIGGSGSFLYDSVHDEFVFVHRGNGTNITSSHFVLGPETYDSLGNETYLTCNILSKGTGKEHLVDSCIFDNGTTTCIKNNLVGTGTISGTTIYGSTAVCSPIGLFSGCVGIGNTTPTYQLDMCSGTTVNQRIRLQRGSDDTNQNMLLGWNNIVLTRSNIAIAGNQTDFSIIQCGSDGARTPFYIGIGGISCFACNVMIGNTGCYFELANDGGGAYIENHGNTITKSIIRIQTSKCNDTTNYSQFIIDPYCGFAFRGLNGGNGNVGIGTTSPNTKLEVKGSIRLDSRSKVDTGEIDSITFTKDRPDASTGTYEMGSIRSFTYGGYAGGLTFYSGRHTGNGNYGLIPIMTIGSTSDIGTTNMGIGTTSPNSKLEVQKTGAQAAGIFINQCSSDEATIRFKSTHSVMSDFKIGASILVSSAFEIYNVQCNRTNYMVNCLGFSKISNDGTFVNGNNTNYHSMNSSGDVILYAYQTGPGSGILSNVQACNNSIYSFRGYSDPYGDMAFIYSNGTFGSRTGTYGGLISDARCKTEICDASSQWNDIKNLRVRNFKLIEDVENDPINAMRQIGFIAQEVETVSPGLVFESGNGCVDSGCWKNVKTSIIHTKAVKALQEAMCRIEIQEDIINILKACIGIN
jgi:hypothetical protein